MPRRRAPPAAPLSPEGHVAVVAGPDAWSCLPGGQHRILLDDKRFSTIAAKVAPEEAEAQAKRRATEGKTRLRHSNDEAGDSGEPCELS